MEDKRLTTLAEYLGLTPKSQGYIAYMEADWPGSELADHQENPYPLGSMEAIMWNDGQRIACQEAQDSEE